MAKGRILRLRGLPWSASVEDVRLFLGTHPVVDVFLRKRGDKSTGEAFVEFETPEEAAAAQADRNHKDLGQRYIEKSRYGRVLGGDAHAQYWLGMDHTARRIFSTDAEDMKALRGEVEEHDTGWVVRLRGLPFTASAEDVQQFLADLEIVGGLEGVVFAWGKDGRPLGEAYVELPSEEAQQEAMRRDRNQMGQRYIEVFKSTVLDMRSRTGATRQSESGRGPSWYSQGGGRRRSRASGEGDSDFPAPFFPAAMALDGSTLRLRGLPYSANAEDVVRFFSGFEVRPEAVQIVMRVGRDGHPQGTGMAYVTFPSPTQAEAARHERHRKSMGSRYIECLPLFPASQAPTQQGVLGLQAASRMAPFVPRGMSPAGTMPGPAGASPLQPVGQPVMQGHFGYEGQGMRGPHARAPGVQMPYAVPQPPAAPVAAAMMQVPMPGPPPYGPHLSRQPAHSGSNSRPQSPAGRGTGWRGSRPASPVPGRPPPVGGVQLSPAEYQQQMLLQHQFMLQQQAVFLHQQQAMSQLRHPGWALSMGGPFVAPYPGPPIRPRPMQQHPSLHPHAAGHVRQQRLSDARRSPRHHDELEEHSPAAGANLDSAAPSQPGGTGNLDTFPGEASAMGAAQASPVGFPPGQGASPASSLQSELQALALGGGSRGLPSRARSQSPGLSSPRSLQLSTPGHQPPT